MTRRAAALLVLGLSFAATLGAARRNSATFDEIVMVAAGARAWAEGRLDLAPDHTPLMFYAYGQPALIGHPALPPPGPVAWGAQSRYLYAQLVFFGLGNDPERLALRARTLAALLAAGLVALAWAFARAAAGETAALCAAALTAFLPDVLGHGGLAYNDVPLALAMLAAVWALDAAVREPSPPRAAVAGLLAALALAVKPTALALGPVLALLLAAEAAARRGDAAWRRRLLPAAAVALGAAYVCLVLVYRGDAGLAGLREAIGFKARQATRAENTPAYLLGVTTRAGFWYYFPVAFLLKTPAALHALLALVVLGAVRAGRPAWSRLLASPLRAPLAAVLALGAALVLARKNSGFRYALPLLPPLCILVGAGAARLLARGGRALRSVVAGLLLWYSAAALSAYPFFLAYTSEYVPRDRGYAALADSSLDWGQGLLELRDFMRREGIERVYLSYFGSAWPAGYGIDYVPLTSFPPLPPPPASAGARPAPRLAVVSATNLAGVYLADDPFAGLRRLTPERVLARTLYVYRVPEGAPGALAPQRP